MCDRYIAPNLIGRRLLDVSVLLSIPPVDFQQLEDPSHVKRFQCELCPYTTAFKCNLDKHIRRHRGEKPYGCTICDYATACQSHLAAHVRSCLRRKSFLSMPIPP